MQNESITARLEHIISMYTNGRKAEPDIDLMAKPISLPPHDMASLFLDIETEFGIDLNQLVPDLNVFSPNGLAEKIGDLCK